MNITLGTAQKQFIDTQVKAGRFVDASEVVRESLRQLEYRLLGPIADGDIMAMAFIVMMEASKSAREDLKSIMAGVKAINAAKQGFRARLTEVRRDCAANATRRDGEPLDFSRGLGSERAYHRVKLSYLDPDAPGGVRMTATDLYPGRIEHRQQLCGVVDRLTSDLDSLSEMGEMESLRLQMAMDRMSKMQTTLSNILKKQSDIAEAITQNLK